MMKEKEKVGEKGNSEEFIWSLIEEEIRKRTKRISETNKLEQEDIVLFSIRSLKSDVVSLNSRIDGVDNRLSNRIDSLSNRMDSNFKWTLGIIIAMGVSIILTIIFV